MHFGGCVLGQNCWFVEFRDRRNQEMRTFNDPFLDFSQGKENKKEKSNSVTALELTLSQLIFSLLPSGDLKMALFYFALKDSYQKSWNAERRSFGPISLQPTENSGDIRLLPCLHAHFSSLNMSEADVTLTFGAALRI